MGQTLSRFRGRSRGVASIETGQGSGTIRSSCLWTGPRDRSFRLGALGLWSALPTEGLIEHPARGVNLGAAARCCPSKTRACGLGRTGWEPSLLSTAVAPRVWPGSDPCGIMVNNDEDADPQGRAMAL